MWRLANCVYRVFRTATTHYYSQDVLIPITTICCTDDDANSKRNEKRSNVKKCDIYEILKSYQYLFKNIEKLQEYSKKFALQQFALNINDTKQIGPDKPECIGKEVQSGSLSPKKEEAVNATCEVDRTIINSVNDLSNLREETMSIINLQTAIDALESGNLELGIETLQSIVKTGTNASAFYNLGICYERGIGVEKDRAKACDYYRQASTLGHIHAQFNLTILSNDIDIDENEDEAIEQPVTEKVVRPLRDGFFRFSLSTSYKEDHSLSDGQFDFNSLAVACL
ncbi:unnamed protein product [Rotaria socialis]|uniref:Death ligand signal enhancer n=1 Tax=Rotaria socialis TaxID=392032 RepID=A0A817LHJ3_9BILA|nr:unnamed protein product [Rotaria socialis]CAF3518783.1 unnamed protein product [Rotaria socialis]CAF3655405.1 unnamed protein product [Rotaria socialis]CAF3727616.1 unnamed protein product [Rotaria socialis]CAF4215593.1 unnamed protein product [Rotaria socialis]